MADSRSNSHRMGAASLGLGGVLLLAGLSHPVQDLSDSGATLQLINSSFWVVGHLLLSGGDILIAFGILELYSYLRPYSPRASLTGAILAVLGVCLSLPLFGVLAIAMPVLGSHADFAAANALFGSVAFPALLGGGSMLQAIGGIVLAAVAWRAGVPTRLAFATFAAGLVVLIGEPALPRAGHIAAGVIIALGSLWLAYGITRVPQTVVATP